jgi:hypothetical protein
MTETRRLTGSIGCTTSGAEESSSRCDVSAALAIGLEWSWACRTCTAPPHHSGAAFADAGVRARAGAIERRLQVINEALLSRPRLAEVARRFGLYEGSGRRAPAEEDLVDRMRPTSRRRSGRRTRPAPGAPRRRRCAELSGRDPASVAQVANTLASGTWRRTRRSTRRVQSSASRCKRQWAFRRGEAARSFSGAAPRRASAAGRGEHGGLQRIDARCSS